MKRNRKAIGKLTSLMLILAICITSVFGCMMSVAADATADATYTVDAPKTVVPFGDKGTAYLTFDLATGFVSGNFTLLENFVNPRDDEIETAIEYLVENEGFSADYTVADYKAAAADDANKIAVNMRMAQWTYEFESVKITVSGGKPVDDAAEYSAADFTIENKYADEGATKSPNNTERHKYDRLSDVSFTASKAYKSVTFQLEYEYEYHVRVGAEVSTDSTEPPRDNAIRLAHAQYSIDELDQCTDGGHRNLTYTDPTLIDAAGVAHTATQYQPEGTLDFFHAHRWDWRRQNPVHINSSGYYIYEAQCTLCPMTHHQVGAKYSSQGQSHNYYEISGINVQYEDNGTVSVNVHVPTATQNEELVICKMDGTPTKYGSIEVTPENYNEVLTDSYYAKAQYTDTDGNITGYDDNILPHGTKMYTIKGLSATDLKSELMLTRCVDKMYLGSSHPFSLEEYALNVITGENVYYPEATTEAQKAADKEVAAAFVNYAVNASNAIDNKIISKPKSTVKWSGEYKIQDEAAFIASLGDEDGNKGTGTEDDPYIIDTPEQLFYISCFAGDNSKDKYYKVSDRVGKFDMGAYAFETTPEQIKANLTANHNANSSVTVNGSTVNKFFQGTFDGNGVIIYGLAGRSWRTGLFPMVTGDVTIKNLTMLSSSFVVEGGNTGAGAIIGHISNGVSNTDKNNITLENCAVKWCYFDSKQMNSTMGTLIGYEGYYIKVETTNCIVLDNYFDADSTQLWPYGGFTGYGVSNGNVYRSCIAIGNAPYSTVYDTGAYDSTRPNSSYVSSRHDNTYHGVYTDQPEAYFCGYWSNGSAINITWSPDHDIQQLTVDQMTGKDIKAVMPYLDWSQWFTVVDGLPRLRTFYTTAPQYGEVLVWDGTIATEFAKGSGSETDPFIIETPEQLAYMVSGAGGKSHSDPDNKTIGKYYKVADGIAAFDMNGFKNITLDSTAENLKTAVRDKNNTDWFTILNGGDWGQWSWFAGHFDGNHVRIFNLYGKNSNWGSMGLFPYVSNTSTIKNVSVENSYFEANGVGGNYGVGGLVGSVRQTFTGDVKIENCTVRDCYMINSGTETESNKATAAHAVGMSWYNDIDIKNCFFANNMLELTKNTEGTYTAFGGIVGYNPNPTYASGVVHVSHDEPAAVNTTTSMVGNSTTTKYTFDKCYTTDASIDPLTTDGVTVLQGGYNDILGGNAVVNMPALHWGSVWFAGRPGKYPMLFDDGIANMPTQITELLNAPVVDDGGTVLLNGWDSFVANYDSKADDTITTTDPDLNLYSSVGINLKDNPYLIVTLELKGEYFANKDKVKATFTVGDQTIEVDSSKFINNSGAGRFHAIRLKDINVANLHKDINVSVSYNGTEVVTGTIGIKGFIYDANRAGPEYEYYALAAKSLIYYSQVLDARAQIRG